MCQNSLKDSIGLLTEDHECEDSLMEAIGLADVSGKITR